MTNIGSGGARDTSRGGQRQPMRWQPEFTVPYCEVARKRHQHCYAGGAIRGSDAHGSLEDDDPLHSEGHKDS